MTALENIGQLEMALMQDWVFRLGLPRDLECTCWWCHQKTTEVIKKDNKTFFFFFQVVSGLNHKADNRELLNQIYFQHGFSVLGCLGIQGSKGKFL